MNETIFSCGRTCRPFCEQCRFTPILTALGPNKVYSHTVKIKTEFNSPPAFGQAAIAMGGTIIGVGEHKLYSSKETGFAITLPSWRFPIILRESGDLAYDDYHGDWGDVHDLDRLKEHYAIEAARSAAAAQGWSSEMNAQGELVIFHPSGGTLTVSKSGTVDGANFVGASCVAAGAFIENAIGRTISTVNKPEMLMEGARVTELA